MTTDILLQRLRARGSRPGLERITRALSALGNPEQSLRVVHIAGTNGKGSTARMLQSVLTAAGYRTGLFTSPAILSPTELMSVDGEEIPPATLDALCADLLAVLGEDAGELTEFEFLTAAALAWFVREHTEIAVVECGMGGLLDATNVFESPLACVFTPIALDHTAFLGDTVEAITLQKSGILRDRAAVVSAPDQSDEALATLLEACAVRGLTLRMSAPPKAVSLQNGTLTFARGDETYTLYTPNRVQAQNAVTVLETVDALRDKGFFCPADAVQKGLADATFPCRQELLPTDPPVLIDGGHNPHGIARLAATLVELFDAPPVLLCGMLADKDTASSVALLESAVCEAVCCTPQSPRALAAAALAAQFSSIPATAEDDPVAALDRALQKARDRGCALAIAGSFYLAAPLRRRLIGGDV